MLRATFLVIAAVVALSEAKRVYNTCESSGEINQVKIFHETDSGRIVFCNEAPCILPKRRTINLEQKFTPRNSVSKLVTSVEAKKFGLSAGYPGVDGTDACKYIYSTDDKKVGCPLEAGTEYVYKNSFYVEGWYPGGTVTVHWALKQGNQPVTCFVVQGKIPWSW